MYDFTRKSVRPFREIALLKRRFNKVISSILSEMCSAVALKNAGQTKLPETTACKAGKKRVESRIVPKPKGN